MMVQLPPHVIAVSLAKDIAQSDDWMPYLGRYLESVPTTFTDKVPTMAVDSVGRLYINPKWTATLPVEHAAYVLLHEMSHNMLNHAERRQEMLPNANEQQLEAWNIAADICVQQILRKWDRHRPKGSESVDNYQHIPGMRPGLSTERYYSLIYNDMQQPPQPRGGTPRDEDGDDSAQGDGSESGDDTSDSGSSDGQDQSEGKAPKPPVNAGSSSDGVPRDYELEHDLTSVAANLSRLDEVREAMENDPSTGQGTGPGSLRQSLNVRLRRQPEPFDQLKSIVGSASASPIGAEEYTYRKRNRRQECDDLPLRGVIRLNPECVIVLDTSGSMGSGPRSECVSRALTAIAHGIRRVQRPRVISWDGRLQDDSNYSSIKDFDWKGGGGTSMEAAVEYADAKYKPDCIVLVTDCGTGWPAKPTRARLVVAMVAKHTAPPKWARAVDLTVEVPTYVG